MRGSVEIPRHPGALMSKLCPFCQRSNRTAAHFCNTCGGILDELTRSLNYLLDKRYRIVGHIKKGGMANVYRAEDQRLGNKPCAIKEMLEPHGSPESQEQFTEWFEREMRILSNLRHGAIPAVFDYFVDSGRFYLVMEYVPGKNLEELLTETSPGGFAEEKVMHWALELAAILDYLHTQNPPVIHRDVKPSNVICRDDGSLILVDFGIARLFSPMSTGTRVGTLGFIAPEHYKGNPEPRSDLFSLGVTLYQLSSGINPQSEAPYNLPPLGKVKPHLSEFMVKLISRLMSVNKEDRFDSARHLISHLTRERPPKRSLTLQVPAGKKAGQVPAEAISPELLPLAQAGSPAEIYGSAPAIERTGQEIVYGNDGSRMVLVEEGIFLMGAGDYDDESYFSELPQHSRFVPAFYIDVFPVTTRQFMRFVRETGHRFRGSSALDDAYAEHPVVNVSWFDAVAYATWAGKRLPLESEWEKAARGVDGRKYPWGNGWIRERVNCSQRGFRRTTAVGIITDAASPAGCFDMVGNVWEWTLDAYSTYPYSGPSPKQAELIAIRGGSWKSPRRECRCAARERSLPVTANPCTGFRCAVSIK